ncbi:hypothetical protein [Endozoicomonas sp. ONNA2]|uniref:hypothetical protein n=1 Tax=Endozoicomonas sp. ONNA2 TaxID=2828741 RepID=UPI00214808E9|nr:hypothetical protein [Endozoicomonas sp. ONNA2]
MKTFKTLALAVAVSAGLVMSSAHSATPQHLNGELGADSAAFFDIFLVKGTVARIWGLKDVELTGNEGIDVGGVLTPKFSHQFCVFSNHASNGNDYKLTVESENSYKLTDSSDDSTINYELSVAAGNATGKSTVGTPDFTADFNAGAIEDQPNPNIGDVCDVKQNITLEIGLLSANPVTAGAYSDRVTMTVEPK